MSSFRTNIKEIKIFLVDDHDSVRESYKRWLLSEDFLSVGECKEYSLIFSELKNVKPDIVLMDIDFSNDRRGGIKFARKILKRFKELKIMFVSHYSELSVVIEGIKSGALGYFWKRGRGKGDVLEKGTFLFFSFRVNLNYNYCLMLTVFIYWLR